MRTHPCLAALALVSYASADSQAESILKPGQFHQFRDLSGLPGAGFGLLSDGTPSIFGALALSTPIGFSLGGNVFDIGFASRSYDGVPRFINTRVSANNNSEGSGQGMVGLGTPIGNFTGTFFLLSSTFDQAYNVQWQMPLHLKQAGVSFGVQNLTDKPEGGSFHNRSWYGVGTYEVSKGDYVTFGWGDVRFKGPFGSACAMIAPRIKGMVEYDTFSINPCAVYSCGRVKGLGEDFDRNEVSLLVGYVRAQFATVALNWAF